MKLHTGLMIHPCCQLVRRAATWLCAVWLGGLLLHGALAAELPSELTVRYPPHPNIVDVTRPPYGAKGDGQTDDTEALQRALNENVGRRLLYFPEGTYLVSATLTWPKNWAGRENWGNTTLQGASVSKSIIRLKDATYTDARNRQAIMWCGGFGSADWFHNYVQNLTFSTGRGNPGAVALQFYSNNSGAVRDCRFLSEDGGGAIGLDLGHRDMNGPLLVQRVEVRGFEVGIATAGAVNSQTFEDITLRGQKRVGFDNEGQAIAIRALASENEVPAVRTYGTLCLLEAQVAGSGPAARLPAIVNYNGGSLYLRDVRTTGYARALGDVATPDSTAALRITGEDKPGSLGPDVAAYSSHAATAPFGATAPEATWRGASPPPTPQDDPAAWAVVDDFGADPTGTHDSSAAAQKALDSGAGTVFFPGHYQLSTPLRVRGKVHRIVGADHWVNYGKKGSPDFRVEEGSAATVFIEHFAQIGGGIENQSSRTLVLRSLEARVWSKKAGTLYLEDIAGAELAIGPGQRLFARQLNIENEGTHFLNGGGQAWILGYKTERGGTLAETRHGGKTEIWGTFSYTTTAGKLAPMFVTYEASTFAFFHEVCFNGDPFAVLIQETHAGETRTVRRGQGETRPYISGQGSKP